MLRIDTDFIPSHVYLSMYDDKKSHGHNIMLPIAKYRDYYFHNKNYGKTRKKKRRKMHT